MTRVCDEKLITDLYKSKKWTIKNISELTGVPTSTIHRKLQRLGVWERRQNRQEYNPNWLGDKVGYSGIHLWVNRHKEYTDVCECCGKPNDMPKRLDAANISGNYKRDINDWEYLCRSCHMDKDGRKQAFVEARLARCDK